MKPPSIKDIAHALDISIGTVDRALHGRAGISPTTCARVLKKAEQLGYRPNIAARSLKLNRRLRIGAYFPEQIASFFDPLRAGVRAAASAVVGVNLDIVFRSFPRLDEGDLELLRSDSARHFDGILMTPGNPKRIETPLRAFARKGVPIICVASDAPLSERLAAVTVDAYASGAIAAELFSRTISKAGHLATITGDLGTLDHAEKLRGLAANLAVYAPRLTLLPAIESHESTKEAYRRAKKLLAHTPYPLGIYISTANSLPVLRALEEKGLLGEVEVIATDVFPELFPFIESGKILATLDQRPFTQGRTALELLLRYLIHGTVPQSVTRIAPHIVLRSNLGLLSKP